MPRATEAGAGKVPRSLSGSAKAANVDHTISIANIGLGMKAHFDLDQPLPRGHYKKRNPT